MLSPLIKPVILRFPQSMATLVDTQTESASFARISIVKAIVALSGCSLKDARDMMEQGTRSGSLRFTTCVRDMTGWSVEARYDDAVKRLDAVGVTVESCNPLIVSLRELVNDAVAASDYDLASELIEVLRKRG